MHTTSVDYELIGRFRKVRPAHTLLAALLVASVACGGAAPAQGLRVSAEPWKLSAPVSRAVVLALGGTLVILGGRTATGAASTGVFELDPSTGGLTAAGTLAQATDSAAGAALNGAALVFGGSSPAASVVEVTAPGGNPSLGALPSPRTGAGAAVVGATAYVLGGARAGKPVAAILATADGSHFRTIGQLPVPVANPGVAVVGTDIYLFGGSTALQPVDDIQVLHTRSGQAAVVGHLPLPLTGASALNLSGTVYIAGGSDGDHPVDTVSAFDPSSHQVTRAGTLPNAVAFAGAAVLAGTGYLVGGESPAATAAVVTLRVGPPGPASPDASPLPGASPVDPSAFAAGSCLAFPPTAGNRHQTVFLDAGHGGPDPGAQGATSDGTPIAERELTLPVVLDALPLLRAQGYRVVVSRTTNGPVVQLGPGDTANQILTVQGEFNDTAARARCANEAHAAVLVSVHFNSAASPSAAGMLTAYDAARPFAAQNDALASLLQSDILAAMNAHGWQIPDGGVIDDTGAGAPALSAAAAAYGHLLILGPADPGYFTTPSQMPGALVEPLYLTDPFEGSIAASAAGQQAIARGLATAVNAFLTAPPTTTSPK